MNMKHKVVYTAIKVTCGWAGAVIRKVNLSIWAGAKKANMDPQTDRPTDLSRMQLTRLNTRLP